MFQVALDESGRWLSIHYSGHVDTVAMTACEVRVRELMARAEPGFRLFTDLSGLEVMDASCAPIVGRIMDLLLENQIASVVRVVPDPQKDIGFGLLSHFHYGRRVRTATYESLAEALQHLAPYSTQPVDAVPS